MESGRGLLLLGLGGIVLAAPLGCQAPGTRVSRRAPADAPIRQVACIYHPKPWLNLDTAGDRAPEGVQFQVYLDPGTGQGVHRDGTFHIKMYLIAFTPGGELKRRLVSDWNYPTSTFARVLSPILGYGYRIQLRWASKDTAGHEVEIVTHYEDPEGNIVAGGTKSLTVPKRTS